MRNAIIVSVIVVVFTACSICSDMYVSSLTDEMLEKLDKADSVEALEALTEEWDKKSGIAELMIDHGEIDILNQYLWAMQVEIVYDYDEFMESKKLAGEMFKHIKERNTTGINNIL